MKGGDKYMTSRGNGYLGSNKLETSVANQEIIPSPPESWSYGYKIRELSFMNLTSCTVVINGEVELFLLADQGFAITRNNLPITSFKIKEANVEYNWIGSF